MKTHRSHDHHPPQRAPWLAGSGTAGPDRDPRRGVAAAAGHASRRGCAGELGTDAGGLSHQEAAARLEHAGPNRLPQARGPSLPRQFAAQLLHFFALLLWVAAVLAFVGQMPQLGWAIIAVVIVNAVFSFVQEYRAERATRALAALLPEEATALRDGRKRRVPAAELIPGDILLLTEGDRVSVDGRVLQADDLKVDNAALTGEAGRCGASTGSRRGPGGGRARACRAGYRRAGAVVRGRRPGR